MVLLMVDIFEVLVCVADEGCELRGLPRSEEDRRLIFWGKWEMKTVADVSASFSFDLGSASGRACRLELRGGSALLPSLAMVDNGRGDYVGRSSGATALNSRYGSAEDKATGG